MLNWDEYDTEDVLPAAPRQAAPRQGAPRQAPSPAPAAPTAAVSAAAAPAAPSQPAPRVAAASVAENAASYTSEIQGATADASIVDAALQALEQMDVSAGLEELEMGAARLEVDDKRMINC